MYGNKADNYERRAPGTAGMKEGVRYQVHPTKDGRHVLFMASEQAFWKNFCAGIDRNDLFEKWPGSQYGDHARGNKELHQILNDIFKSKTAAEWIEFGNTHNTPIAPVNTPDNIVDDPQFQAPPAVDPERGPRRRHAPVPRQGRRRRIAVSDQGTQRRPAHRRRVDQHVGLRRGQGGGAPRRRRRVLT